MDRVIFHIDVNNAFLSWEAVYRLEQGIAGPDLRTIACAVGGDIEKRHGVILAKSPEAKKYKVQTGEPITDALKKCPNLLIIPPTHDIYPKYSKAFVDVYFYGHRYGLDTDAFCAMYVYEHGCDFLPNLAKIPEKQFKKKKNVTKIGY